MIKLIGIIILTLCFAPFSSLLALHDDETLGKGGAWESNDAKKAQPSSPENEKAIDTEIDKTFRKSPIVIPSQKQESDDTKSDDPESDDPDSASEEINEMKKYDSQNQ